MSVKHPPNVDTMSITADDFFMTFTFFNPLMQRLATPIDLTNYDVALTFITVPHNFHNVSEGWVDARIDGEKNRKIIPAGFYLDAKNLTDTINDTLDTDQIVFSYNPVKHSVKVEIEEPRHSVMLSPSLASLLRLPTGTMKGPNTFESFSSIIFSGWSQVFYVTTNFTLPQMCNGRLEGIMAAFSTASKEYWRNNTPTFVPVKPGLLETISINIVTPSLQNVYFLSGGITIVLHFRKRQQCVIHSK